MSEKFYTIYENIDGRYEYFFLDEEMNTILIEFFNLFFNNLHVRFKDIEAKAFPELEKGILEYFDRRYSQGEKDIITKQDYLFNNLTHASNHYKGIGLYNDAQDFWIRILKTVRYWEKTRGERIHKGSLYYFWADAAILNNEIDKGIFLIHEAFVEDKKTFNTDTPGTPAEKTVQLNYKDDANFLFGYITRLWEFFDTYIENYNRFNSPKITREKIFAKFTSNPPSADIIFSFVHSLAKIEQLMIIEPDILSSDFAGLYELNLLFDLVLVIDNLIYSKVPTPKDHKDWMFFSLGRKLLLDSKIEINNDFCEKNLSSINKSPYNFDDTIISLLNMTFPFPNSKNITPLYRDICICYCIRNHSAHNISLTTTISNHFKEISQSVFNVLFLCIEIF
jgi:hypothetical protein